MSELTVDRPQARLRRQPDPEGRLADARARRSRRAARTLRQRQDDAAARGRRTRAAARRHDPRRRQGRVRRRRANVDVPAEGRNLGLVFQSYALWPHKTVSDNVGLRPQAAQDRRGGDRDAREDARSTSSRSDTSATAFRISSPAASSSASRSRARSSTTRRSSCSTSRCRTSTPSCARKRAPGCAS